MEFYLLATTRAVHLELSIDITTHSFLMTLRRFIAQRGEPDIIWCDNGSNFASVQKELKQALQNIKHDLIAKELALRNRMEIYTTNPPLDGRSLGNNGQTNKTCIKNCY